MIKYAKNLRNNKVNCTPFVRQYDILNNKWGAVHGEKSFLVSMSVWNILKALDLHISNQ